MEKKEWYAVINGKIPSRKQEKIIRALKDRNIDLATTTYLGQATEFAGNASGCAGIVSVGGDGTLHEVINGIDLENQKVAIIPAGTINCLARFLGIRNAGAGMKLLDQGAIRKTDLISVSFQSAGEEEQHRYVWGFLTLGRLVNITTLAGKFRFMPK
ncbi:MAG: acylglycerol kinase family protein, partial [Bacteroidales bacterium]